MIDNKETFEKIKEILETADSKIANADNPQTFKAFAEEYMETLCQVYDIDDLKLNEIAIKSYHKVSSFLETSLLAKYLENRNMLWHFTMILKAFMERLYLQACRKYD